MGLLDILERVFTPSGKQVQVELKEIYCKGKGSDYIKKINTAAVGCELSNPDGSSRQQALKKLKAGDRVRLIWNSGEPGKKDKINLLLGGRARELDISACFGRLSDKVASDVVKWLTKDNIVTSAKVIKVTGATRKRPKLGCVIQLTTYNGPT